MRALVPLTGATFWMVIQVGAPILGELFLTDAAWGFVAHEGPQMIDFIVGIPVEIAVGTVLLVVTAPLFSRLLLLGFGRMDRQRLTVRRGM